MNVHEKPTSEEERLEILTLIRDQTRELWGTTRVTCASCKRKVPVRFMYQCFFCGLWFCKRCAAVHFGTDQELAAVRQERDELLKMTEQLDEHPEGYDGPCHCRLCLSYATDDEARGC